MANDIYRSGATHAILWPLRNTRHGEVSDKHLGTVLRIEHTHAHLPAAVRIEWRLFHVVSEQVEVIRVMCSLHIGQQTSTMQHHLDHSIVIHRPCNKETTVDNVHGKLSVGKSRREETLGLNEEWMEFRLLYPDSSKNFASGGLDSDYRCGRLYNCVVVSMRQRQCRL